MKSYFLKSRVETFSDGIFAIIVTLLVLELKVPAVVNHNDSHELLAALLGLLPKFISWLISFFTVCVIWVNHHRLFKMLRMFNHGLFWWNAVLLLLISFIPFPTAVIGDFPGNQTAVLFYGLVMTLMALTFSLIRVYLLRNDVLLISSTDKRKFITGTIYSVLFGPVLYMSGALISFIHPYISFIVYFGIAVYFIFPHSSEDIEVNLE